jgi:hypothetical protein
MAASDPYREAAEMGVANLSDLRKSLAKALASNPSSEVKQKLEPHLERCTQSIGRLKWLRNQGQNVSPNEARAILDESSVVEAGIIAVLAEVGR